MGESVAGNPPNALAVAPCPVIEHYRWSDAKPSVLKEEGGQRSYNTFSVSLLRRLYKFCARGKDIKRLGKCTMFKLLKASKVVEI